MSRPLTSFIENSKKIYIKTKLCYHRIKRGGRYENQNRSFCILRFLFLLFGYFVLLLLNIDQPFQLSAMCGSLFALLLFSFLVVYEKVMAQRYSKFEKEITSPIFYKTNGNFYLGGSNIKNGNIYFCEDGIVCVCLEEKPYTLDEISLQNIDHFRYTSTQLSIFTNYERVFVITLPKVDEIIDLLICKGWIAPR